MFVKTSRASAWLDQPDQSKNLSSPAAKKAAMPGPGGSAGAPTSDAVSPPRFARRAFEAPLGRCVALRVQPGLNGRPDRLLVLLVPRYVAAIEPRWMPLDQVLTEAQARKWIQEQFGS
jgi:hypothetical protein